MKKLQQQTPLFDAVEKHKNKQAISFHVPGHKNGVVYHDKGKDLYRELLKIDATELDGLDDLHGAEGPILEAEQLLSDLYGTQKSYLLINGSTVGNLAMVMGLCNEGDVVLVQRNCHKSVMNAIKLAKLKPVFLQPAIDMERKTASGLLPSAIIEGLKLFPDAKALILTYPSYFGAAGNVGQVISEAKKAGLYVLVDEAHGAHFKAGSIFPPSSLELGADFVVQSAHKTLPAMTMGSFLHVNKEVKDYSRVENYLRMLQSSSPSYPIMVSLDLARSFIGTITEADLLYTKEQIQRFRHLLRAIAGIYVLDQADEAYDILKITIQPAKCHTGYQLQSALNEQNVFTELADLHNVLFIFPILKNGQPYPLEETAAAVERAVNQLGEERERDGFNLTYMDETLIKELAYPYPALDQLDVEYIPLTEAAGRVAGEDVIPYPPGIPVVMQGERLQEEYISFIKELASRGAGFHGASRLNQEEIAVYIEKRNDGSMEDQQ